MSRFVIYLREILNNLNRVKASLPHAKICAVIKANAYGFGYKKICYLLRNSVDYFAVARLKEFLDYKKLDFSVPCLILNPLDKREISSAVENGAEMTISNLQNLIDIQEISKTKNIVARVHLKIDSGLSRFGLNDEKELDGLLKVLKTCSNIQLVGVYSHIHSASNQKITAYQRQKFQRSIEIIRNKGYNPIIHFANSEGLKNKQNVFDMVRLGFDLYDLGGNCSHSLEANVLEIKNLQKGQTAGYDAKFCPKKPTKIAICSIGYADGVPRRFSKKGYVLIKGIKCKVVAICMDVLMVDISATNDVQIGEKVVVFGKFCQSHISVCDFAKNCDTIPYEIYTNISNRVKRIYKWRRNASYIREISSKKTY